MSEATLSSDVPLDNVQPAQRRSCGRFWFWTVALLVIGGMVFSIMLPSLCRPCEGANRVKCGSNLGQAISQYAQSHGGQYPPSLAVLLSAEDMSAEMLICPSSNDEKPTAIDPAGITAELTAAEAKSPGHKPCISYLYTGKGLTTQTATATTIVAYEPPENHQAHGTNVLFGDGHVDFISKQDWPNIAADAGIAIAAPPGK